MSLRSHTGIAVQSMVKAYLLAIGFVMFTLLVIALAIDLGNTLDDIRERAADTNTALWRLLLPYMSYRAVDIVTRLLVMASLAGGFVATLVRHQRMEDVVLSAAGAPPTLLLSALLMVGVVTGTVQASFQNWVRPIVVQKQVDMQLGRYARWFGDSELGHRWFVADNRAMRAAVTRGADAHLSDIQLFEGISQPELTRIILAQTAEETATPGVWRLSNARVWEQTDGNATQFVPELEITFPLNRDLVAWYGIHGIYLPNDVARRIATLSGTKAGYDASAVLAVRTMAFFLPGVFALLGASLARSGTQGRRFAPFRLVALATLGYVLTVFIKVFWALAQDGRLDPYLAISLPIGGALGVACLLQLYQAGYLSRQR